MGEIIEVEYVLKGVAPARGILLSEDKEKFRLLSGKSEVLVYKRQLLKMTIPTKLTKEELQATLKKEEARAAKHRAVDSEFFPG